MKTTTFNWNNGNEGFESYVGEAWDNMARILTDARNTTKLDGKELFKHLQETHGCEYIGNGMYRFIYEI